MSDPETVVQQLREHVDSLEVGPTERVDRSQAYRIVCGDDGVQIAFRGTCPKCGSESWVPADLSPTQRDALRRILEGSEVDASPASKA